MWETIYINVVSCKKFYPNNFLLVNSEEKFEVLTAVNMTSFFFWVVTSCRLIRRYQHFGEIF
jgi:hypothetical protein